MFKKRFCQILENKKKLDQLSQAEIAKEVGVKPASISDWKAGRSEPSIKHLKRLAKVLDVPIWEFFTEEPIDTKAKSISSSRVVESLLPGLPLKPAKIIEEPFFLPLQIEFPHLWALKVSNNAMYPEVAAGDIVFIKTPPALADGMIVLIFDSQTGDVTLYRLKIEKHLLLLVPSNPSFKVEILKNDEKRKIIGIAIGMQRRLCGSTMETLSTV